MDESEVLKQAVLRLRQSGVTTPEIYHCLGLELDTVLTWLMTSHGEPVAPAPMVTQMQMQTCDRIARKFPPLSTLLSRLSEPASQYGYRGNLWTPSRLVTQFNLPRGTLYRWLKKANLAFLPRLRQQFSHRANYQWWVTTILPRIQAIVERRQALLYLLDELRSHDLPAAERIEAAASGCLESEAGQPVLICGISLAGRIAGQIYWCRHRVAADHVYQVLQGLMRLHPHRNLVILAADKRAHRAQAIQDLLRHHPQLQLVIL